MNDRYVQVSPPCELNGPMMIVLADGWIAGDVAPPSSVKYERLTPCLGVTVDLWDAELCCWRRGGRHAVEDLGFPYNGVLCANQDLPWRSLPAKITGQTRQEEDRMPT